MPALTAPTSKARQTCASQFLLIHPRVEDRRACMVQDAEAMQQQNKQLEMQLATSSKPTPATCEASTAAPTPPSQTA